MSEEQQPSDGTNAGLIARAAAAAAVGGVVVAAAAPSAASATAAPSVDEPRVPVSL